VESPPFEVKAVRIPSHQRRTHGKVRTGLVMCRRGALYQSVSWVDIEQVQRLVQCGSPGVAPTCRFACAKDGGGGDETAFGTTAGNTGMLAHPEAASISKWTRHGQDQHKSVGFGVHPAHGPVSWLRTGRRSFCDNFRTSPGTEEQISGVPVLNVCAPLCRIN